MKGPQDPGSPDRRLKPGGAEPDGSALSSRDVQAILAAAEQAADEMRLRGSIDGRRARSRAAEEARALVVQARRDALEIVKGAREEANAVVAAAREEEAELNTRIRLLRGVVSETKDLLASLHGDAQASADATEVIETEPADHLHIVVAAEQSRVEKRWRDDAELDPSAVLPESVRRLLDQLKCGER